jgi:hypothetical protein
VNPVIGEQWLRWWVRPWHWADPSWASVAAERELEDAQFAYLSAFYPDLLGVIFGVHTCEPSSPDPLVAGLLQGPSTRDAALAVVDHLCSARASRLLPDAALKPWCRSVAKALRPGSWLPTASIDPLELLAQWSGPEQWGRLRLLWPRHIVQIISPSPSQDPRRLEVLWRAALHRVLEGNENVCSPRP